MPAKNSKLLARLILSGLLVLLLFGAIATAYNRITDVTLQLSSKIMQGIGKIVVHRTENILQDTESQLASDVAFATTLPLAAHNLLDDAPRWTAIFWQQLQQSSYVNSIYLADMQGNMVQAFKLPQWATRVVSRQGDGAQEQLVYRQPDFSPLPIAHVDRPTQYDPRTRPWFQATLNTAAHTWSSVYRFESSKKVGITLSQAALDAHGNTVGIFGVDITLEGLADFLARQVFGEYDIAMIINDKHELVAYPLRLKLTVDEAELLKSGQMPTLAMIAPEQAWVLQAAALPVSDDRELKVLHFANAGTSYAALSYNFPTEVNAHWRLLIVAPETDLIGGTSRALQANLTLVILSLVLFVFILYLAFGRGLRTPAGGNP